MQEGKFTTGSYPVFFEPDLKIIATSNPIDYTHSGKIIEPLFDRLRSHIETRYPQKLIDEMLIIVQEIALRSRKYHITYLRFKDSCHVTQLARKHGDINQDKGVSVRMSVHSTEVIIAEAERIRSIIYSVKVVPRFSDIHGIYQTSKFELSELDDNNHNRIDTLNKLISNSINMISKEYIRQYKSGQIKLKKEFKKNKKFVVSQKFIGTRVF